VVVWQVRAATPARAPGAVALTPGDFVLEATGARAVVGGMERGGEARGGVLEMLAPGMPVEDGAVLLAPRVRAGARALPLRVTDMRIVARGDRPAVRIEAQAGAGRAVLHLVQEMTLRGDGSWLSIRTSMRKGKGYGGERLRLGGVLGWGGKEPFVPGAPALDEQPRWERAWLGAEGRGGSVAFGYLGRDLRVQPSWVRHGEARFLAHTEVWSEEISLERGRATTLVAHLVSVRGNQAEAVRRLGWARGRPFPEVRVDVPDAPAGAYVEARTPEGRPVIRSGVSAGAAVTLPLPPMRGLRSPRRHVLIASAPGHAESDPVEVVAGDRRVALHIPEGGYLRVSVRGPNGEPLAARVRISGVGETPSPQLGLDSSAAGAGDTVLAAAGAALVPLPPGRYAVWVSRGPEWTLVHDEVTVTRAFRPHVDARLEHVVDPGDWVPCDFHVHAAPSYDSEVLLEDRIVSLRAEGVRFAVATDHNHVTDYGPTLRAMGLEDFGTVPGVEVSTWSPAFGHFNAYPFPVNPALPGNGRPAYHRTTPRDLFRSLRAAGRGMVVQVNHPRLEPGIGYYDVVDFDPATGREGPLYSDDYDVIEVFNGFDLARLERVEQVFQDWLHLLARGQRVVANGSSDSHQVRFQWAGYPRTYVRVDGGNATDADAVLRALRAGRAFVTSGPFLEAWVAGRGMGEVAAVEGGVLPVRVRLRAPPWMEVDTVDLFVGPELVRSLPVAPVGEGKHHAHRHEGVVRFDEVVELPAPSRDSFVVVRARGARPLDDFFGREDVRPLAFTNPIWIDADGDGTVPWVAP
jgi:hypothetical protein